MSKKYLVHDDGLRSHIEDEAAFWGLMDRLAKRMEDPYRQAVGRRRRVPETSPTSRTCADGERVSA
jgi:hypothetical protein